MDQVPEWMLAGVPVSIIIAGLVEAFKSAGVPENLCPWVSIAVGAGLGVLIAALEVYPDIAVWVVPIVGCAVLGMAATGLYKIVGRATWKNHGK